jgi:hypothetical protein
MNSTSSNVEAQAEQHLAPGSGQSEKALPPETTAASTRKPRKPAAAKQADGETAEPSRPKNGNSDTKSGLVLKLLRRAKGASLPELTDATGWQVHSVRGFLSGTVKKKLGLSLKAERGKDGQRRYHF